MKLLLAKRGNVIDLMTSPLFITIVALGLVGLTIFSAITQIGSSTTFEQKSYSADAALLIDSLYAVRKDVNLNYIYLTPENIGFQITPNTIIAYTNKTPEGNKFYYTQDYFYSNTYGNFAPGKPLIFFKIGNKIGATDTISKVPDNLPVISCDSELPKFEGILAGIEKIGPTSQQIFGQTPLVYAQITQGPSELIIYTNNKKYANALACAIAKSIRNKEINFEGYSIIPITPLLAFDDTTKIITSTQEPAVFVKLQQPKTQYGINVLNAYVYDAMKEVLT